MPVLQEDNLGSEKVAAREKAWSLSPILFNPFSGVKSIRAGSRGHIKGTACWGLLVPWCPTRPNDQQYRRSLKAKA